MVKRKPNLSRINIDLVRFGVITAFFLLAVVISGIALVSFVRHSSLFVIRDVVISKSLGEINIPEFAKLKGQNIFLVDLAKVEQKVIARYPGIAGLEVLRRFPDEISVAGTRRMAFAAAMMEGKRVALSRDGCFIGVPGKEDGALVNIKGFQRQKSLPGTMLTDPLGPAALKAVELVQKDPVLTGFHLRSLDVSDPDKITLTFGLPEDPAKFDVLVDKVNCDVKLTTLSFMVTRTEFAVNEVKYIDLRFDSPVIGKRKTKK